jgi:hypothetical protein
MSLHLTTSGADNADLPRMSSSRMLHRVALVRIHVSEKLSASIIRVTKIGDLVKTLGVTSNRRTLRSSSSSSSSNSSSNSSERASVASYG